VRLESPGALRKAKYHKTNAGFETSYPLSIALPVHNEAATLPRFLEILGGYLDSRFGGVPVEIVIINNGSTDGTARVARSIPNSRERRVVYREYPWRDYSEAVRRAVLLSTGERIAWLGVDIDDIASIGRGLETLEKTAADLVILSKYRGADWRPARRVALNRAYNFLGKVLDGMSYSDIEGYMIITGRVRAIFESLGFSRGNTINLNLLYFAKKQGMRVVEAPFYVKEKRESVFLRGLSRLVWMDIGSMLTIHQKYKRFAEMRSHRDSGIRQP